MQRTEIRRNKGQRRRDDGQIQRREDIGQDQTAEELESVDPGVVLLLFADCA